MTETLGLTPSQTVGPYLSIGLFHEHMGATLVPTTTRARSGSRAGCSTATAIPWTTAWSRSGRRTPPGGTRIPPTTARTCRSRTGSAGFGRSGTVDDGWFEFTTVKPGRVPMPDGRLQAPHIVVGVFARGLLKRLVTRIYFPDEEEANASDPVLAELGDDERATLVARAEDGGLRFDIRLQGDGQTTFFAV